MVSIKLYTIKILFLCHLLLGKSGIKAPRRALDELNIRLEALKTQKAVNRFNELSKSGENVAAALHLTC